MTGAMLRPRRPFAAHALAMVVLAFVATASAADGFVPGIADLPLMPGLGATDGDAFVFDSPAGRIVQASATGPVTRARVEAFYAETLPELGWRRAGAGWRREDEVLRLEIADDGAAVTVRFELAPAGDGR